MIKDICPFCGAKMIPAKPIKKHAELNYEKSMYMKEGKKWTPKKMECSLKMTRLCDLLG